MLSICITGTIGSGKSRILDSLGRILQCTTVQADVVGRDLMQIGAPGYTLFKDRFSGNYLLENGNLDRAYLKKAIAASPSLKNELEELLHPLIRKKMMEIKPDGGLSGELMLYEVPLLFEVGWQRDFDLIVGVYVNYQQSRARLMKRDSINRQYAENLMALQMSSWQKALHSDMVIDNSYSYTNTMFQLLRLVSSIRAIAGMKTKESAEKS